MAYGFLCGLPLRASYDTLREDGRGAVEARSITHGAVTARLLLDEVAVTDARHGSGTRLPLHAHPSPCLTLVLAGAFEEAFAEGRYWCRPGHVVLKPAGAAHANRYGDTGARSMVIEIAGGDLALSVSSLFSHPRVVEEGPLEPAMEDLRRACERRDGDTAREVRELLRELPALIERAPTVRPNARGPRAAPSWLRRIHDRVCEEFRRRPPIEELATEAGVHPDHVCRSFRQHFGYTVSELVRRRRVERAAASIRTSDRTLSTIAFEAGFADQSHMTREMRRYLGVTPGELRGD